MAEAEDLESFQPLDILGTSGLKRSGGFVREEWHPRLNDLLAIRIYTEMKDNDPIIGAILYTIESLVRQAEWRIVPASEDAKAVEAAQFVESCLNDMSHTFDDAVSEHLSMLPYGWSLSEIVYKQRRGPTGDPTTNSAHNDGRVGWRKIALRAQDTRHKWEFDEDGGVKGMWQVDTWAPASGAHVFIPLEKSLLFRTKATKNNPEGRSVLRNSYRPWFFLKRLQEYEAIGFERDLAGYPVFEVPPEIMSPTASTEQKAIRSQIQTQVQQIRRDEREGMVIPAETGPDGKPTGYKFRLMTTGSRRQMDVDKAVRRYEQRIAMSMLAEFIMLGMDKVGSFALASVKTKMFSTALGSTLDIIADTYNRFAIPRLMEFNPEFPRETWPRLEHGDLEAPDLGEVKDFIGGLTQVGAMDIDEPLKRHLRAIANLPAQEDPDTGAVLEEQQSPNEESPDTFEGSSTVEPIDGEDD